MPEGRLKVVDVTATIGDWGVNVGEGGTTAGAVGDGGTRVGEAVGDGVTGSGEAVGDGVTRSGETVGDGVPSGSTEASTVRVASPSVKSLVGVWSGGGVGESVTVGVLVAVAVLVGELISAVAGVLVGRSTTGV